MSRRVRKHTFDSTIVAAAARAGFVQAWADWMEEKGESLHGELMDQAPVTPAKAKVWAKKLLSTMERMNGLSLDKMYERAAAKPLEHSWERKPTKKDFGHYTAMQALGHGVAWSDDHPRHGFKIPHAEFHMMGARDLWATVSARAGIASRG